MPRDRLLPIALSLATIVAFATLASCTPEAPTPGPEARCTDACVTKAHACSPEKCARGCRLVMDKLVEHEGARVLACVARAEHRACDDMTFAECAARTGPYADGGPAPPHPPTDDDQP